MQESPAPATAPDRRPRRFIRGLIAAAGGVGITALATLALQTTFPGVPPAGRSFQQPAVPIIAPPRAGVPRSLVAQLIPKPQQLFGKDRITVLVLGIDYNYDERDQEYSKGARSDTIMAVSLDFPARSVHVLSIPRDMDVVLPSGSEEKINAAYALGGPHTAEQVVAKFLGIPGFDRYVTLRINASKALIDAIGGLEVPVSTPMDYDDTWGHLHIHFRPGLVHMNGEQAVSYSRFRHDALGDIGRIRRQQQILRLTLAKLKASKLTDLHRLSELLGVVSRNVDSDLSASEKLSLAQYYAGLDLGAVKAEQVPYVAAKDLPTAGNVLLPDEPAKVALVAQLLLAPVPLPGQGPADARALQRIRSAAVRVDVENGSGLRGVGAKVAAALHARGFAVGTVRDAASYDHAVTEIHVEPAKSLIAQKVRSELNIATAKITTDLRRGAAERSHVVVILGRDAAVAAEQEASAVR